MRHLIKHIRDDNRNPVATVVVVQEKGNLQCGVALCDETEDTFEKRKGVAIALGRALTNHGLFEAEQSVKRIKLFGKRQKLSDVIKFEYSRLAHRLNKKFLTK